MIKLLAAFFGYMTFGWFGVILGLMIGHFFEQGYGASMSFMTGNFTAVQQVFFQSTFEVMGFIAKADGRVTELELQAVRQVMAQLNLDQEQKLQAIQFFNVGKSKNYDIKAAMYKFKQICGREESLIIFFLEIQLQGAMAEGSLKSSDLEALYLICNLLGVSTYFIDEISGRSSAEQHFYRQRDAYSRSDSRSHSYSHDSRSSQTASARTASERMDAYGILGLTPAASAQEIKKAYRKLMNQHHPDKLAAKGLPEAMRKIATEKTQRIQKAYEVLSQ